MIKFPGQYYNFRKTTLGENIISFSVDKLYSQSIKELVSTDIGTEFVVHLEEVTDKTNINQDNKEIRERFVNKMHAQLGELAELKDITPKKAKDRLKEHLKEMGLIKESTKELDLKGIAIANNIVRKWIEEN